MEVHYVKSQTGLNGDFTPKQRKYTVFIFSSVQFSHSIVSNSLRPHGLQHTRVPCPSPTPGARVFQLVPWKKSYDQPRQHIKKQRHYFANKDLSSQSYGFSSGHVWMWELDYKESWAPKNWYFLNCGVGEDSWELLGLQGDPTSPS